MKPAANSPDMAAHALTEAAVPLLAAGGYSGRNLAMSTTAHAALNAWITLRLIRIGLSDGLLDDTRIALTLAASQAHLAPPRVAERLRRDLIGLNAAWAVANALTPRETDRRAVLIPLA